MQRRFIRSFGLAIAFCALFASSSQAVIVNKIAITGNSMVYAGADASLLSNITGVPVQRFGQTGCTSPFWFTDVYKLVRIDQAPSVIVVVFRSNEGTSPDFRMWKYKSVTDAGINTTTIKPENLGGTAIPVPGYSSTACKNIVYAKTFNLYKQYTSTSDDGYSWGDNIQPDSGNWNFKAKVDSSLVPDMIKECKAKGIKLVFLAHRISAFAWYPQTYGTKQQQFFADFADYCNKEGVHLLNYSAEPTIDTSCYKLPKFGSCGPTRPPITRLEDHINYPGAAGCSGATHGRTRWSTVVGEDLKKILANQRGPREMTDPALFPPTSIVSKIHNIGPSLDNLQIVGKTVKISGDNLQSADIYSLEGKLVKAAQAKGNTLEISSLPVGSFIAKIYRTTGATSSKITILP